MKYATLFMQFILLLLGCFFSLATSAPYKPEIPLDDTWIARNVYENQTAYPVNQPIDLAVGYDDFATDPSMVDRGTVVTFDADTVATRQSSSAHRNALNGLETITLQLPDGTPVPFTTEVKRFTTRITPTVPLMSDQQYILAFNDLRTRLRVDRPVPDTIEFSTAPVIHVLDMWRNNDTLIVSFSAPLSETTTLSTTGIDILWEENNAIYSVAGDTNPANYLYETGENLFMITAPDFLTSSAAWLRLGPSVTGRNGEPIRAVDVDDPTMTVVLLPIEWDQLSECQTREDVPEPCIRLETEMLIRSMDGRW